jgi:hypothetical protein
VGFPGLVNLSASRPGPGFLAGAIEPGNIRFSSGTEWLVVDDERVQTGGAILLVLIGAGADSPNSWMKTAQAKRPYAGGA